MIINKEYFKKYSPIPLNFNLEEVMLYVPVAEKIWVQPLIGDYLFDEIQHQIDANEVSENNSTLLLDGGLYQYLCFATVYECLPLLWGKISEVGIVKGKSDNSDSLSLKDMTYIESHIRNQVEVLKSQTLKWLCERKDIFPLFHNCQCCECEGGLKTPNPDFKLYGLKKRITELY